MAWTFEELRKELMRARDPHLGRQIERRTKVRLVSGTQEQPLCIAIRHHDTDILKLHSDGTKEVCTGWTSNSTLARIQEYGRISVHTVRLPSFNGRRPSRERAHCLGDWRDSRKVIFSGVNGYIRIAPDGTPDISTVKGIEIEIIADKKKVAQAQKRAKALFLQIAARIKLGAPPSGKPSESYWWLRRNIDKPLDEIDLSTAPAPLNISGTPMWFAGMVNALETVRLKEFSCLT